MKRLPNLDVLRFVLILYVILIHVSQLSSNQGLPNLKYLFDNHKGNEAIAVFFVMSGFLIIRIIYRAKLKNSFSIQKFYMRRILKIFPLYYLITIFGFTFYHAILPVLGIPFETNYNFAEGVFYYSFFMANVFSRSHDVGGILGVLWSLAIEEQFYIIIAPFLFFIRKRSILISLSLLFLIYFFVFHIEDLIILRTYKFEFFFLFFGGIIAILEEKSKLEFLKISRFIPLTISLVMVLFFSTHLFDFESLWVYNLFATVLFGLFIHAISINNFGVAVTNKRLIYFGEISYGLYVYHVIVVNAVIFVILRIKPLMMLNDTLTLVLIIFLTIGLTIFVAHISFKYFETYFLNLKEKFR